MAIQGIFKLYLGDSDIKQAYINNNVLLEENVAFDWGEQGMQVNKGWFDGLQKYLETNPGSSLKTSSGESILGTTKSVTLNEPVLGTTTHLIRVIGVDQDGDNTVTFQTANCLNEAVVWSAATQDNQSTTAARWIDPDCKAKQECINYYNAFPGKGAIKIVKKGTCDSISNSRNGTATYTQETVFLLSEREIGKNSNSPLSTANSTIDNAECTQGKNEPYAYYATDDTTIKIKTAGDSGEAVYYWLRCRYYKNYYLLDREKVCTISKIGGANTKYFYTINVFLAPAFVIGNN